MEKLGENIAKAIVKFHAALPKVPKNSINPHFKSKYASLSDILEAIDPILHTCGLAVVQLPQGEFDLETILVHDSGETVRSVVTMKPTKSDPQGFGSAVTYYRRYALGAILSLNIDDDDDGNEASKPAPKPEPKVEAKPVDPARKAQLDDAKAFLTSLSASNTQIAEFREKCKEKGFDWAIVAIEARDAGVESFAALMEFVF